MFPTTMTASRPQLRRCRLCQKTGHNTGTCPAKAQEQPTTTIIRRSKPASPLTPKASPNPVRFFVHHVDFKPRHSRHVVDLKSHATTYEGVEPSVEPTALTAFSHQLDVEKKHQTMPAVLESSVTPEVTPEIVEEASAPPALIGKKTFTVTIPTLNLPKARKDLAILKDKFAPERWKSVDPDDDEGLVMVPVGEKIHVSEVTQELPAVAVPAKGKILPEPKPLPPVDIVADAQSPRWQWLNFGGFVWQKRLAFALVALLFLAIVPNRVESYYFSLKQTAAAVTNDSAEGFMALQESTGALLSANIASAGEHTVNALSHFTSALDTLSREHTVLQKVASFMPLVGPEVKGRMSLIEAGQSISLGNTYLIKGINETVADTSEASLLAKTQTIVRHIRGAMPHYNRALELLSAVEPSQVPPEYQKTFIELKLVFSSAVEDLNQIARAGDVINEVAGAKGLRRYLVVFQNSAEIRPTGGFMGSFAEVDVRDGKIVRFDVPAGGTYDVEGQLRKFLVPPAPFLMLNKRWEFQDANWFPDFAASAEKMLWFYRNSERGGVDGVIAINSAVLPRLLSIVGPLSDEKRGLTLDASSALSVIQSVVEEGAEKKANKPKQIIQDTAHTFMSYFSSLKAESLAPLLINLKEALDQKDIQIYFSDPEAEAHIVDFGWGGTIAKTAPTDDYLMVVNTNIQGEKSDAKIRQAVTHQTVVEADGSLVNTVTVSRGHYGTPGEKFYGKPNINYIRFYVPEGSELIEAKGFSWPDEKNFRAPDKWSVPDADIARHETEVAKDPKTGTRVTKEFGKYAFANWIVTEPGTTSTVEISYRLPFRLGTLNKGADTKVLDTYRLVLGRQSGVESSFASQIIFPDGWTPVWKNGDVTVVKNGALFTVPLLRSDTTWAVAFEKNP